MHHCIHAKIINIITYVIDATVIYPPHFMIALLLKLKQQSIFAVLSPYTGRIQRNNLFYSISTELHYNYDFLDFCNTFVSLNIHKRCSRNGSTYVRYNNRWHCFKYGITAPSWVLIQIAKLCKANWIFFQNFVKYSKFWPCQNQFFWQYK